MLGMDLFNEFVDEQNSRTHEMCSVARIKTHLTPEDAADLDRALSTVAGGKYRIEGAAIARRLNKLLGEQAYNIKGSTIQRHRNGGCDCA